MSHELIAFVEFVLSSAVAIYSTMRGYSATRVIISSQLDQFKATITARIETLADQVKAKVDIVVYAATVRELQDEKNELKRKVAVLENDMKHLVGEKGQTK